MLRSTKPCNCQELLFEDVFWVKRAQKDYDVFVAARRGKGIEMLDVNALLAETLDMKEGHAYVLDHRLSANQADVGMIRELRGWLDELPSTGLAEYVLGGLATDDLLFSPTGLFGGYPGRHGFILPPLPFALFTRNKSA